MWCRRRFMGISDINEFAARVTDAAMTGMHHDTDIDELTDAVTDAVMLNMHQVGTTEFIAAVTDAASVHTVQTTDGRFGFMHWGGSDPPPPPRKKYDPAGGGGSHKRAVLVEKMRKCDPNSPSHNIYRGLIELLDGRP
jgi:hypothetical protein